ncbi:NADH:flavin oxidoreductase [Rhodospirillaceae bacterium SYSU D60014]|uniref:oxidoreductase n=1 Tax=Virgifigura deserti TaxID=2268457 RepID=UPI000E667767
MTSKDPLLQPFQLKHLTLKNRVMSTAHEPAYSEDGMPKERYRLYHEEKAKGGIALTVIGGSAIVAPDSAPAFGNLYVYKDEIVPWFRELSDAVHAHGCAVMCQITHLGRRTNWNKADWLPVISPSPVREPAHRAFPKEAEDFDLRRVVKAYGDAARRCREGGLDGIEIEAYGHLFDAFWSPATNQRTDAYGGSLENRLRFGLEVLEEIRRQVGQDYIVGVRLVVDEDRKRQTGVDAAEGLEIARRLVATGWVDFLNVIKGHIDTDEALSHVIPSMGTPAAPHLALAGDVRREMGVPVFHAARINDVATARYAVSEGLLDMVGMTRAHMADPHIVAKIERGEEQQIRPCVGASYCIDRIYEGNEALCVHNPATGREATMPHVIRRTDGPTQKVVVVGAGPAGLEAARVAAARGHEVVLLEASAQTGGQVRLAAALSRRKEIVGIVDWRTEQCERLGVSMRFNILAEAEDVRAEKPDVAIIATGGLPNTSFLPDGEDLVVTTWDILSGAAKPADDVLLFDDNGAHPGMTAAEAIALAGARLEIATPERTLAPDVGGMNYPAYFKVFAEYGVTITLNQRLIGVRREGNKLAATLYSDYARATQERLVDQVVVEHGTLPFDDLYFALKPDSRNGGEIDIDALTAGQPQATVNNRDGAFQLFRIGDAVSSRNIHAAIYDALRLCVAM